MVVMLTLGRLRRKGESEASKGCIGPSQKSNRHTSKQENICLSCCMGALGEKWNVNRSDRWPRVDQCLRLVVIASGSPSYRTAPTRCWHLEGRTREQEVRELVEEIGKGKPKGGEEP